jgi:D-methionine transport system permease protein
MSPELLHEILIATWQTIYMVIVSGLLATCFGLPIGIILLTTKPQHILAHPMINRSLSALVNALRSIPFIILLIAIIPFTRLIVGTSIGTTAAIVPLTIGAIPFIARIVENALAEINPGLIETGTAIGASPWQIIRQILVPESLSAIVNGVTVVTINLVGYSAMAGAIGGGGLGDFAIRYGYQQFNTLIMLETVVILIILVQVIQWFGDWIVNRIKH